MRVLSHPGRGLSKCCIVGTETGPAGYDTAPRKPMSWLFGVNIVSYIYRSGLTLRVLQTDWYDWKQESETVQDTPIILFQLRV